MKIISTVIFILIAAVLHSCAKQLTARADTMKANKASTSISADSLFRTTMNMMR